MHEFRTTDRVCEELDKMGVSYRRCEPTGVIAEIKGNKSESDRVVVLRADMDALSIQEKTGLPFASVNDGFMHACGHDSHTAMLMGAVKVVNQMKDEFSGVVRFLFQPGEETCEGAPAMIKQGAMDNVDYAFGVHIDSMLESGKITGMVGASYAATDRYWIRIAGKTSHGADPAHGIDAAVCGASVVMNLQTMVSREFDPAQPVVVTVGRLQAGTRFNIIPGECEIEGTIRTYSREIHDKLPEIVERIAKNTAQALRCTAEVEYHKITEVLYNDEEAFEIGKKAAEKVCADCFKKATPTMGGEDFAFYTDHCKAAFFNLGARVADDSKVVPMHHECMMLDESAFERGVALYAQVAMDALSK